MEEWIYDIPDRYKVGKRPQLVVLLDDIPAEVAETRRGDAKYVRLKDNADLLQRLEYLSDLESVYEVQDALESG